MSTESEPVSVVKTSRQWVEYFTQNAAKQRPVLWESGAGISETELAAIAKSLRGWQLGETSDGAHLTAAARNYAKSIGDPEFLEAVKLFIAEEQRHGAALGRFLELAGVKLAKADWGDFLFRSVRYAIPRMEIWATPVVMVETHAMVYYNALRRATKSPVLRAICEQILADEVPHIRFQCERLAILHRRRPQWIYSLTMLFHRFAFTGITLAVWLGHGKALKAGGYGFRRFWKAVWGKMEFAWRTMNPKAYHWVELPKAVHAMQHMG
jgi:hypothetical protein